MSDAVFRAIARFGKRDANHDYEWLWGRDAIPEAIFGLCEYLALMANENSALLAMAAALPTGVFLARSFHQGSDAAQRPTYALEVGTLSSARPLSTEQLLGFAWSATQGAWSPAAAPDGQVVIEAPEAQEQTVTLQEETVLRARLGLPLTVAGTTPALAVLRRFPQRYQGVAIAPKLRGAAIPWRRELATLLCVHFGEPDLDAAESALLEHTTRHPPTEEEWQALDLLSPSRMRAVLLWAAGEGPFPGPAGGAPRPGAAPALPGGTAHSGRV